MTKKNSKRRKWKKENNQSKFFQRTRILGLKESTEYPGIWIKKNYTSIIKP